MSPTERYEFLAAIIRKAETPELAARAIIDGGFCNPVEMEPELFALLDEVNSDGIPHSRGRFGKGAYTVHLTVSQGDVRVAAGRWRGCGGNVREAVGAVRVTMAVERDAYHG